MDPWAEPAYKVTKAANGGHSVYEHLPLMPHNKSIQITGGFERLSVQEQVKQKTRGSGDRTSVVGEVPAGPTHPSLEQSSKHLKVDQRTHKVFKTIFYTQTSESGDIPIAVKWVEFKRAMGRVGFSIEKLQGSAWQFTPGSDANEQRSIQFHEPHPDNDIPFVLATRFGRRPTRVYGWNSESFKLA